MFFKKRNKSLVIAGIVSILCFHSNCFAQSNKIIVINIPTRTLELIENHQIKYKFPVGVGRSKYPTPIGNFFRVISKIKDPKWQNPYKSKKAKIVPDGKGNPLGQRWIGFVKKGSGEYGMHGTNKPFSVGKYVSHGCVRMYNKDVKILFDNIEIGTPVKINNYTYKVEIKNNDVFVKKYSSAYKSKGNISKMIQTQLDYYGKEISLDKEILNKIKNLKIGEKIQID